MRNTITSHPVAFEKRVVFQNAIDRQETIIVWTTLIATAGLGVAVAVLYHMKRGYSIFSTEMIFTAGVAAYLALAAAVFLLPIHITCLRRKSMLGAGPLLYGIGLAWMAATQYLMVDDSVFQFMSMTIGTLGIVIIMAVGCRFLLPDTPRLVAPQLCPTCGYDLRGSSADGCPECGWGRDEQCDA